MDNGLYRASIKKRYCQYCGIGAQGFSMAWDWTVQDYIPIWDQFGSLSCPVQFKISYSNDKFGYELKDDAYVE